ncbi:MAG: Asp-tRNA(Asn)/Glu-tRNA(Gln) amidotransferase subunit GatC [bacterium]
MPIPLEQVKKLTDLSRMELPANELKEYQEQLSSILDYVGQLSKFDLSAIQPLYQITDSQLFREDEVKPWLEPEKLADQAPRHEAGLIITPSVRNES